MSAEVSYGLCKFAHHGKKKPPVGGGVADVDIHSSTWMGQYVCVPIPSDTTIFIVYISITTLMIFVTATMNNGLLPYWGLSTVCSSVGFLHPVYTISYGYGLSMLAQSAYRFWNKDSIDTIGKIHLGLVGLYGVRMVSFLLWRSSLKSYKAYQERDSTKKEERQSI